ncbi:MAG TPA: hypothetical protein VGZ02_17370 [Candidatus Baltobacteraceae bacterium]|nr:hypothetical protein [Candidatus Baltobacteraceae bacterium]
MPSCVVTAPGGPDPWPTPERAVTYASVNDALLSNPPLLNIAILDSNLGHNQRFHVTYIQEPGFSGALVGPGDVGTTPDATTDDSSITTYTGILNYNLDHKRGNMAQIFFREYDKAYYDVSRAMPAPVDPERTIMRAVVAGKVYRWNISKPAGYQGYEYLAADDDLKTYFGIDRAFAVYNALALADNPPNFWKIDPANQWPYLVRRARFITQRPVPPQLGHVVCKS